ncbi:LptF/LptG family permease [Flavobacterium sp. H122]|uniref:LptF/LptG family permease n=1 Tax=Flavobacterium sp. H122 TaxID=2529860 RepID=UPI0010AA4C3A|nr:LptF/LptG family permease [Flavobacterium sp. H122]
MKILDRYLLKSFLITFTSVFVILFFIFILQTVWLFISELAGKDLDIVMIVKFLAFATPKLMPMVLPLTVLLSSIMMFGDLAEHYEFAAMKSAGVSFFRALKILIIFIFGLSLAAFFFANNVIPYSEYKFINFRKNIAQVKPAMAIAEGQFNDIGNINIKVEKKSGDKGEHLEGVTIHKKSNLGEGAKTVIKSKKGELISSLNSNLLQLVLIDGYYYEDITPKDYRERNKLPFAKVYFKKYNINIDLSKLNTDESLKEEIKNTNTMLKISDLRYSLDSLTKSYKKEVSSFADNNYQRFGVTNNYNVDTTKITKPKTTDLETLLTVEQKPIVLNVAESDLLSAKQNLEMNESSFQSRQKEINNHWHSIFEKFVIAYACILMFFIGAPLGAIIRKGGLGLPIVFAMLIFITFHFMNTFGKKMAQESQIAPFLGAWMSSIFLTPLAIYLTKKAVNDNGDVNFDFITEPFQKIYTKLTQRKTE